MLVTLTPLVCTCAGFTPGGSLRKKRPSLSRPVPWCDVLGAWGGSRSRFACVSAGRRTGADHTEKPF